jgi:hypothetical protein
LRSAIISRARSKASRRLAKVSNRRDVGSLVRSSPGLVLDDFDPVAERRQHRLQAAQDDLVVVHERDRDGTHALLESLPAIAVSVGSFLHESA